MTHSGPCAKEVMLYKPSATIRQRHSVIFVYYHLTVSTYVECGRLCLCVCICMCALHRLKLLC